MTTIVRRTPFGIVDCPFGGFRGVFDRFFDEAFVDGVHSRTTGMLPIDVAQHDGKLLVTASLPGFTRDEVAVEVEDGVLSIKAEHDDESTDHGDEQGQRFYRRERRYGAVSRRLTLPNEARDGEVDAELTDGVLTLSISLPEQSKPKQIEIKSSG